MSNPTCQPNPTICHPVPPLYTPPTHCCFLLSFTSSHATALQCTLLPYCTVCPTLPRYLTTNAYRPRYLKPRYLQVTLGSVRSRESMTTSPDRCGLDRCWRPTVKGRRFGQRASSQPSVMARMINPPYLTLTLPKRPQWCTGENASGRRNPVDLLL